MENKFNIGEVIKFLRDRKRYTLRDLADKSEVSFSQLSKIERGDNQPTRDTVMRLANCLDFDPESLLIMSGYAPDGMQQEFMKQWQILRNRRMHGDIKENVSETGYNYNLNSREYINKYIDSTIHVEMHKSKIFNELMENFNSINEKEKVKKWLSFIDDMEERQLSPDGLLSMLEERDKLKIAVTRLRDYLKLVEEFE